MKRLLCSAHTLLLLLVLSTSVLAIQTLEPKIPSLENLEWRSIGPAMTSGRIADIAVVDSNPDIVYVATATGGAWKSTNRGTSWEPVFDKGGTASLGAIAVAPRNPNLVWIGSGEAWSWRSSSWGNGVYKSEDGGKTWEHRGLEETRHVGRILIHPEDPNIVYIAALGGLWGSNEERGLFKTVDGGRTWEKVLYISPRTGVVDVAMDPREPDRLYAAAFQRERRNWSFLGGGPESGLYKTEDGGANWQHLQNGLPKGQAGRIGVSVCRSQPDTVYAAFTAEPNEAGIYRSDDRGASWTRGDTTSVGKIRCDPGNPERVYVLLNGKSVSEDGGKTLSRDYAGPGVHVDQHAMWIDPANSDHLVIGNDGGVYFTHDRGEHWRFVTNLPVTQFYTVAVDMQEPFYYVYGGTQDNYTIGGPSGTRYSDGIANEDWYVTSGGDGFHVKIDPEDSTVVYSESQYGRLIRFDTRTGERRHIQPAHPPGGKYRWNWSSPLLVSHFDRETLYFAANVVFRSPDRGDSWEVISPDLTRQISHFDLPLQGQVQPRDAFMLHRATSDYGNITTLSESKLRRGLLAVGTDDGLIHVSIDEGAEWKKIDPSFVPERTRVSRLLWSAHEEGRLYATFDAHKDNDFRPYVFKSEDFGVTWESITSNLPDFGSTRVILEHPDNPDLLFLGTEFETFVSLNKGTDWISLKNNMPTVPVHDMLIHPREKDLVLGTHGRGFFILEDTTILQELTPGALSSGLHLASFPAPATQLHDSVRGRNFQGHTYFAAPNSRGVEISYYLDASLLGGSEGNDTDEAATPEIRLEILDRQSNIIRHLEAKQGKAGAGIQRLTWDLRHERPYRPDPEAGIGFLRNSPNGAFVLPGAYQVRLQLGDHESSQMLQVRGDPAIPLSQADRELMHATLMRLARYLESLRATLTSLERTTDDLESIQGSLKRQAGVPAGLDASIKDFDSALGEIRKTLLGDQDQGQAEQPGAPALADRVRGLYTAIEASTARPTQEQLELTDQSRQDISDVISQLNRLNRESLPEIGRQLDELGIPWTPGRPIPAPEN